MSRVSRALARLGSGQRAAVVVAWGAIVVLVGMYVASGLSIFGYASSTTLPRRVGYAPLTAYVPYPSRFDLTALECFFVWLGLVGVWLAGTLLLLRARPAPEHPADPSTS